MAFTTNNQIQVLWAGPATSVTISGSGNATSLAVTQPAGLVSGTITVRANATGSPSANHWVYVTIIYRSKGAGDFDTPEHGYSVGILRCDIPGENPAQITVPMPVIDFDALKIHVRGSSGNNYQVSADVNYSAEA